MNKTKFAGLEKAQEKAAASAKISRSLDSVFRIIVT